MEIYSYEANKSKLLFITAAIILICILIFNVLSFILTHEYDLSGESSGQMFSLVILAPFVLWAAALFISILLEKYSKIEFNNAEQSVKFYNSYKNVVKIPFSQIKLVKFQLGQCVKDEYYTKVCVYTTNNKYYKITIPGALHTNDYAFSQISSIVKFKETNTFLLLP